MYFHIYSGGITGVNGYLVSVETDVSNGFPKIDLVGLPNQSIKESIERVRTALRNRNFTFPYKRITVNLAPARIKKYGTHFDLAVALGILAASQQISSERLEKTMVLGELSLQGDIKPIRGALAMVEAARKDGIKKIILPRDNIEEVFFYDDLELIGISDFTDLIDYIEEGKIPKTDRRTRIREMGALVNFSDIKGNDFAKRGVQIAVSGMHSLLLIGTPGTGKTMLAKGILGLLPDLNKEEKIEITRVYSAAGKLNKEMPYVDKRSYRSPHHSVSLAGLLGGGRPLMPGEISLAHKGVLFLDEIAEFKKSMLDSLRQPLEDKKISLSRLHEKVDFPADFLLVASMNPCPCGYYPDGSKCKCSDYDIRRYHKKLSGPMLDRIDLFIEIKRLSYEELRERRQERRTSYYKERIDEVMEIQSTRYKNEKFDYNSQIPPELIEEYCALSEGASRMLQLTFNRIGLSVRSYHRLLRLARTIADTYKDDLIKELHLAEAISLRRAYSKFFDL